MTNPGQGIRLVLAAALLGSIGLLTACGSDQTTRTTTTTERTTTMQAAPPATTVTSTQTQQYRQ